MFAPSTSSPKVVPLVKVEGVRNIDLKPSREESLRGRNVCRCADIQDARARVIAAKVNELFGNIQGSEELLQGGDFRFEITSREIRILSKETGHRILGIPGRSKAQEFIEAVRNARCSHGEGESVSSRAMSVEEREREQYSSDGEGEESERSFSELRESRASINGSSSLRRTDSFSLTSPSIAASSFPPPDDRKTIEESGRPLDSHEGTLVGSGPSSISWTRGVVSKASLTPERKDESSSEGLGEIREKGEESLDDIVLEGSEGEETHESSGFVAALPDYESKSSEREDVVASSAPGKRLTTLFSQDLMSFIDTPIFKEEELRGSAIEDPKNKEESDEPVLSFDITFLSNAPSFAAPMVYSSPKIDGQGKAESMIPPAPLSPPERASITMPSEKKRKDAKKPSVGEGESSQKSQGFFSGFTNTFTRFRSRKKPPVTELPRESSTPSDKFMPQGRKLNQNEVGGV